MNEISHSISADISQSILSHFWEKQCICVYIDLLAKIHFFKNNYYKVNASIQYTQILSTNGNLSKTLQFSKVETI